MRSSMLDMVGDLYSDIEDNVIIIIIVIIINILLLLLLLLLLLYIIFINYSGFDDPDQQSIS